MAQTKSGVRYLWLPCRPSLNVSKGPWMICDATGCHLARHQAYAFFVSPVPGHYGQTCRHPWHWKHATHCRGGLGHGDSDGYIMHKKFSEVLTCGFRDMHADMESDRQHLITAHANMPVQLIEVDWNWGTLRISSQTGRARAVCTRCSSFVHGMLAEMPTSVALPTSDHFHPSACPVVSLSLGILHEYLTTQTLAKPSLNLLQRIGGEHWGGHAQLGWRTFMITCLCWILGYMRLEIRRKIGLSANWCLSAQRYALIVVHVTIGLDMLASTELHQSTTTSAVN